jgi:glycosyltransferase involved in cell wall biosynthesis
MRDGSDRDQPPETVPDTPKGPPHTRVSVVVAVRNAIGTIQACLDSVLEQRHAATELVVMDGASSDGTREVLARNHASLAYWESAPDRGISHAWNKALDHVSGEWVLFLGADDRLAGPDVLARMASSLAAAAGRYRVVYGSVEIVDGAGHVLRTAGDPWDVAAPAFRKGMSIPHQAVFHARALFDARGRYDEGFRIMADYDLLLRELLAHDALFVPGVTVTRMGEGGLSQRPESGTTLVRELHRAWRRNGLLARPPSTYPAVMRAQARDAVARVLGRDAELALTRRYRRVLGRPPRSGPL